MDQNQAQPEGFTVLDSGKIKPTLDKSTFDYLKPTDHQQSIMAEVRHMFSTVADTLNVAIPDGPDKTYLLRKLREVAMWANIAITRNADGTPRE